MTALNWRNFHLVLKVLFIDYYTIGLQISDFKLISTKWF